jgi:2-desacetyl-2-hydroxyethyl bacteriochlorophyllide A dehydrogenase
MTAFYNGNGTFIDVTPQIKAVKPNEVRIKVSYCGICGTDYHIAKGELDGRIGAFPQAIGHEASGIIDECGENVREYKKGDRVIVRPLSYCGECPECKSGNENVCRNVKYLGIEKEGAFQPYWNVEADVLHKLPDTLNLEPAALVEPLAVCCHAIQRSQIKQSQTAVVIGGGPIGFMTALVLKSKGIDVTVSEINSERSNNCIKAGITTINPAKDDLVKYINDKTTQHGADVVFEASGSQGALNTAPDLISPNGKLITIATYSKPMNIDIRKFHYKQISIITTRAYQKADFEEAIKLLENKTVDSNLLISKIMPLKELTKALEIGASKTDLVKILIDCRE